MKLASLQRAVPNLGYCITMAFLTGTLFTLAGLEISRLYMAPIFLFMLLITLYQFLKTGVIAKPTLDKKLLSIAFFATIAICSTAILVVRELRETFGIGAPLTLGLIIVVAAILLFKIERRNFLNKINARKK